jgi:hypothetical protein
VNGNIARSKFEIVLVFCCKLAIKLGKQYDHPQDVKAHPQEKEWRRNSKEEDINVYYRKNK